MSDPRMTEPCLVHARRAVELGPRVPMAWFAYGDALGTVGKYQDSRQAYLRAVEIDPNYGPAMADLSLAEIELGRYDDEMTCFAGLPDALELVRASRASGTLPPGMYFAALRYGGQVMSRSVVLVP